MNNSRNVYRSNLRKIVFLLILGFIAPNCFSQDEGYYDDNFNLPHHTPNVSFATPEVMALTKYVDLPVSLYTGIPEISIPIYEIKTTDFSLPINVSYHASGIKVEEVASWVGLGWSLNAGGIISRTVKGLPDDQYDAGEVTRENGAPCYETENAGY